jgi:hypothetical protein
MSNDLDLIYGKKQTPPREETESKSTPLFVEKAKPADQPIGQSTSQLISQSTSKSAKSKKEKPVSKPTHQPDSLSTGKLVSRLTSLPADNKIVNRPKAFYILERLDRKIDDAVRYLQDTRGIKKADRSVVVNAYLDNDDLWTEEAIDQLVDRVISQLTRRLTGQ